MCCIEKSVQLKAMLSNGKIRLAISTVQVCVETYAQCPKTVEYVIPRQFIEKSDTIDYLAYELDSDDNSYTHESTESSIRG